MKRVFRLGQVALTVIFVLSFSLQGIQPAAAQDGSEVRIEHHAQTGKVSFIGAAPGRPINVPAAQARGLTQKERALAIIQPYAADFGLSQPNRELKATQEQVARGRQITRFQQTYQSIPVLAGELVVNATDRGSLLSINGEISPDLSLSTTPAVTAGQAQQTALESVAKWRHGEVGDFQASEPQLWVYDARLLQPDGMPPALVWRMDVTSSDPALSLNELVLVDAQRGNIRLHFNQVHTLSASDTAPTEPPTEVPPTEVPPTEPPPTETPVPTEAPTEQLAPQGEFDVLATVMRYVATTGTDTGDCTVSASPCLTINYAIGQASAGETIAVATGTYTGSSSEVVTVNKSVTLSGGWNSDFSAQEGMSVLDGGGLRRGVYVQGGAVASLERVIIQNGYAPQGGGILIGIPGWLGASVSISHSVIRDNHAIQSGGGIDKPSSGGTLTIDSTTIQGNTASTGGGMRVYIATATITNSTIAGNSAAGSGGAAYFDGSATVINASTITGNSSSTSGGGFYRVGSPLTLRNSILSGNTAAVQGPDCYSTLTSAGHNIIGSTTGCTITAAEGDLFNTDPQLPRLPVGSPAYYPLQNTSPAIDAGDPATCPTVDQRGVARPQGDACDIGAFEYATPGVETKMAVLTGGDQHVGPGWDFPESLAVYVLDADDNPVPGVTVTFTAPDSGATGAFADSHSNFTTAETDGSGIATAAVFTANAELGSYVVQATTPAISGSVDFALTNRARFVNAARPDDSGDCASPATACKTIDGAVAKAIAGEIIEVAAGTYTGSGSTVATITKAVTLSGGWNSDFTEQDGETIIDGQDARRVISATATGTVSLSRLTIQNGYSTQGGAGIFAGPNVLLVLEDCIVQDNTTTAPYGIYNLGAGIYAETLTINRCEIADNHAQSSDSTRAYGGGIYATTLSMADSYVHDNSVHITSTGSLTKAKGGGIYAGTLTLSGTTLSNNAATGGSQSDGGGAFATGLSTINNSTIFGNEAPRYGGGMAAGGAATINNSTIAYNEASGTAGLSLSEAGTVIRNSIIARNIGGNNCSGTAANVDHSLMESPTCTMTISSGVLSEDPHLVPLPLGDPLMLTILGSSPAVDAGNPATCLAVDQRGVARPYGAACDTGAYEFNGTGSVPAHLLLDQGSGQFLHPGQVASTEMRALVVDASGAGVPGVDVTFTTPASGATGTFSNDGHEITVATDSYGVAAAGLFTANNVDGAYTVLASAAGLTEQPAYDFVNGLAMVRTYSMGSTPGPDGLPGTLVCDSWDAGCTNGSDPQADAAQATGTVYLRWLYERFGRPGLQGDGLPVIMSVHWSYSSDGASWYQPVGAETGQALFGNWAALADDVVAHELTHGVTVSEANLLYWYQSGAIDESLGDIFGELFDQTYGRGNDTAAARWIIGEDMPGHPVGIRSMKTPTISPYYQPDKMISPLYDFDADMSDSGGVHTNSGIGNKAAFLLVDGGAFNNKTVAPLGVDKTLALYYEVDTHLLTSGSDYADLAVDLYQACLNLAGGPTGMTYADCTSVQTATAAVQMSLQPKSDWNSDAPYCTTTGTVPVDYFSDNFESGLGNWTLSSPRWKLFSDFGPYAHSGTQSLYADDYPEAVSDTNAMLTSGITIPAGAFLHFSQAYDFEYLPAGNGYPAWYFDGGVLEYSADGGAWTDAGSMMQANRYDHSILPAYYYYDPANANPLAERMAFSGDSHGYISTRVTLSTLAGKNVRFRWRMGTDQAGYFLGWWIDDVRIYTCNTPAVISGTTGVAGTTLSYFDGSNKAVTADSVGKYSFIVPFGWSGTVTPSKQGYFFTPESKSFSNVLTSQVQNFTAVRGTDVYIAGNYMATYPNVATASALHNYADIQNGPVRVTTNVPIFASERGTFGPYDTFNEVMGYPNNQLTTHYWFPWYDNVHMITWVLVGNPSTTQTANVTIKIGNVVNQAYTIPPMGNITPTFSGIENGPVEVLSNINVFASQRVLMGWPSGAQSFDEVLGFPHNKLTTHYWFTWYDNKDMQTAVMVGNPSTTATATVTIKIAGATMDTFSLPPRSTHQSVFDGVQNGPVEVLANRTVFASERGMFGTSGMETFNEVIGFPHNQLTNNYWFPWYDNQNMITWVLVGNPSATQAATVTIKIAGSTVYTNTIPPMGNITPTFAGVANGPVQVTSNIPVFTSERVLAGYPGTAPSFNEILGIAHTKLTTDYWFTWYDNKDMSTDVVIGKP